MQTNIRFFNNEEPYKERDAWKEAAEIVGVSMGYISDGKRLQESAPDLFEEIKLGTLTISQAKCAATLLCLIFDTIGVM